MHHLGERLLFHEGDHLLECAFFEKPDGVEENVFVAGNLPELGPLGEHIALTLLVVLRNPGEDATGDRAIALHVEPHFMGSQKTLEHSPGALGYILAHNERLRLRGWVVPHRLVVHGSFSSRRYRTRRW